MYPLHLASCVINEPNSIPLFILELNTLSFSLFKPHSSVYLGIECLPTQLNLGTIAYCSLYAFTEILLVGYFVYHFLNSPSDAQTSWRYVPSNFPPGRVRRAMEIPKKG